MSDCYQTQTLGILNVHILTEPRAGFLSLCVIQQRLMNKKTGKEGRILEQLYTEYVSPPFEFYIKKFIVTLKKPASRDCKDEGTL